MTQSPNRLSKEREAEIRERFGSLRPYDKSWNDEKFLLGEIDALRTENARYEDIHAEYLCANTNLHACMKEMDMEHAIWEKHSLCELVKDNAKLRTALESIAARHLDPFCPELFDDYMAAMHEDARIAREALK